MKIYKRLSAFLLSLLAVILLLPVTVFAAGRIDLNQNVSLTVSCQAQGTPLTGVGFQIYFVASVDERGELTKTDPFQEFNVDIRGKNDEAWWTLASTLEGYVLRDQITPTDSGKTDSRGQASFPTEGNHLTPGLYLVLGERHTQGGYRYDATPFMVMLPGQDMESNVWVYDMTADAKFDATKIPDETNTITRKVLKVWKDDGHEQERPEEVVVQLLKDGKVYDTVTLNAGNNWRHSWTNLNDRYKWTVVEKEMDHFTVEVERDGITFVVTNTYDEDIPDEPVPTAPIPSDQPPTPTEPDQPVNPDEPVSPEQPVGPDQPVSPNQPVGPDQPDTPEETELPQTGQLWWPVPVLLATGLLLVVIGLIRRRGASNET